MTKYYNKKFQIKLKSQMLTTQLPLALLVLLRAKLVLANCNDEWAKVMYYDDPNCQHYRDQTTFYNSIECESNFVDKYEEFEGKCSY